MSGESGQLSPSVTCPVPDGVDTGQKDSSVTWAIWLEGDCPLVCSLDGSGPYQWEYGGTDAWLVCL